MVLKNRMYYLITAVTLAVFACLGACSSAPSIRTSGGFQYQISQNNNSECVIIGYTGSEKDIVIPERIKGRRVVTIGDKAFENSQLTSVVISDGVRRIGANAFRNNQLASVVIPGSVTEIGRQAFENNQLTSIAIPDGVTEIRTRAFQNNRLASVVIHDDVIRIGEGAFRNNQLASVVIPDDVRRIEANAFRNNKLTSVAIPGSVRVIDDAAFDGNPLGSITINSNPAPEDYPLRLISNVSITVSGDMIYITSKSLGDFSWAYAVNNKRSGTYTKHGDDVFYNGAALPKPAIITTGPDAWLASINGRRPVLYCFERAGWELQSRSSIESRMIGNFPYPSRITSFFQGSFYLPPGQHTIEVIYLKRTPDGWSFSVDTTVWEQRYLFEGYRYDVTAEPTSDGRQISFGIRLAD